jgi:hypothetical protein
MILVSITQTGRDAASDDDVRTVSAADWRARKDKIEEYGDALLAIDSGQVRGAYRITGWERGDNRRVTFRLERDAALKQKWVGEPSPLRMNAPLRYWDGR